MDSVFKIGDFCFRLIAPQEVTPPENFMLFEQKAGEAAYTFEIVIANEFPKPRGRMVVNRPHVVVFEEGGLEMRYIGLHSAGAVYACYREEDDSRATIFLARSVCTMDMVDPMFLSMFCMERHMINHEGIVLHCAYMQRGDSAILFSAASETGKTTQATLWEKHRGTRVVNGDRALLDKCNGVWAANGWPVCGSSGVCHNESMPIRAIVMLSQGKENTIEKLSPFQAFSQVYSQITINSWNRAAQQHALDLLEDLVQNVPFYHLSCTISQEAVKCLEDALLAQEKGSGSEE